MQTPTPDKIEKLEDKVTDLASRVSRIEGILEQMSIRLTRLAERMEQGFAEIRRDFRWMIGIQFTTLVTLGTLILLKLG